MKKSDKLLLIAFVTILALFTVAFMDLKRRATDGIYEPYIEENPLFMVLSTADRPVYVSVSGVNNITVIPSDTFAVGYIRSLDTAIDAREKPVLKRLGDSLVIAGGYMLARTNGDSTFEHLGQLMIYGPKNSTIVMKDGNIRFQGLKDSGDCSVNAILYDTRIVLGEPNKNPDDTLHPEYFSRVFINSIHGNIDLAENARIQELHGKADSQSRMDLSEAHIGKLYIQSHPHATVILSGEQLMHLTLEP